MPDSADRLPACRSDPAPDISLLSGSGKLADIQFRGFDEHGDLTIKRRHLPHWEQPGATYFVTFRLADAVASDVLAQWREERAQWLKLHPHPWDWKTAREYMRRFEKQR